MADKLPATPRSSKAPEFFVSTDIQVVDSRSPTESIVSPLEVAPNHGSPLEVSTGQGIERNYEPLHHVAQDEEKVIREEPKDTLTTSRRRRWRLAMILFFAFLFVGGAVGGGVGGWYKHKHRRSPTTGANANNTLISAQSFNSSVPLGHTGATPAQWRGKSIYQIITDRFGRSDSTSPACDVADRKYCGGTWQGIIGHLDYIQNMGFTAIWISPITAQIPTTTGEGDAYHGYWQQNIYELNSHFGTPNDLQALATAVHARNMYLMVDVVFNHFGWNGNENTVNYSSLFPFSDQSFFHPYCPITAADYTSNQKAVEDCWLGDNLVSLPDLNTTSPSVVDTYYSWIKSLVSIFGIDGLRIDTVKHVQPSFWSGLNAAAGVYSVGEVLDGDPAYTCPYQQDLDGVLNYPLYYPLTAAFSSPSGNMSALASTLDIVKSSCKDSTLLGTFTENQDNPRFPNITGDMSLDKNVIAFTLLADGIPIIYQGQEQHYSGGNDPFNREDMWSSSYSTKSALYGFVASVNQIRNQIVYKTPEWLTGKASVIHTGSHDIAMRKGDLVSVFSNQGANASNYEIMVNGTGYKAHQQVLEILTCGNVTTDARGNLPVTVEQGLPKIFYPTASLAKSGICFL